MDMNYKTRMAAAAVISLAVFWISEIGSHGSLPGDEDVTLRAARLMGQAVQAIAAERERRGVSFESSSDPNRTGLIGPQDSPLVTTVGELEAKRTTANPNMAGLIVLLLRQAGVKAGDSVAIGSSGSFPALLVASLAAAKAMDVQPVVILSLGASSYGATDPHFDLLDIFNLLQRERICTETPTGVSLGGDKDVGLEFETGTRDRVANRIRASGLLFLHEPDLRRNVDERMRLYRSAARGKIAAFINSGGGFANLGTSRLVLDVKPGLNTRLQQPPAAERGVLFEMVASNIPVIHLLYVRGLAQQAGLPWDPIPLPQPEAYPDATSRRSVWFWPESLIYLVLLGLLIPRRR
jgi:poly-gamma-glutamate system protein